MLTHFSEFAVWNIKWDTFFYFLSTPLSGAILGERSTAVFGIFVSMVTETQQALKKNPIIPPSLSLSPPSSRSQSTNLLTTREVNMVISAFIQLEAADALQLSQQKNREQLSKSVSASLFVQREK